MARTYNGTTDAANMDSGLGLTSATWSLWCRFKPANLTAALPMLAVGINSANHYGGLLLRGDNVGDLTEFQTNLAGTGTASAQASGVNSTTVWWAAGGQSQGASSRFVKIWPGAVAGSNTTNIGGFTPDRIWIGRLQSALRYAGDLAEVAGWSGGSMTEREFNQLGAGFSPRRIRPANLVFYKRLLNGFQDVVTRTVTTVSGTTDVRHPPCMW